MGWFGHVLNFSQPQILLTESDSVIGYIRSRVKPNSLFRPQIQRNQILPREALWHVDSKSLFIFQTLREIRDQILTFKRGSKFPFQQIPFSPSTDFSIVISMYGTLRVQGAMAIITGTECAGLATSPTLFPRVCNFTETLTSAILPVHVR